MDTPPMLELPTKVARQPFVHRYSIFLKAHYFLFFSAFGMLYPVINITLRSRGLSTTELSYINIIIPFLVFFTNPIMGFIADRLRRHLLICNIVIVIFTISYGIIFMLPPIKSHNIKAEMIYENNIGRVLDFCASQEVATKCASRSECGCSYKADCTLLDSLNQRNFNQIKTLSFAFTMNSNDINKDMTDLKSCGIEYRVPIDQAIVQYTQNRSFYLFPTTASSPRLAVCEITCSTAHYCHGMRHPNQMRFIIFYSLAFVIGTNFLTNSIALGVSLGFATIDSPRIFGEQRVWGTIGFGISAFAASRLYKIFQTEFVYIIMFIITTMLCVIITSFIRVQEKKQNEIEEKEMDDFTIMKTKKPSPFALSAFFPLLKQLDVIVFLSLAFIWGMSYAVLDPYLYLYVDEMSPCQSHSIVGWMSAVAATAEVLAFFLAGRLLKLLGTNLTSVIILLAFAVRFAGYYYIRRPYFLTFMEPMHFFNFGILYVLVAQETDAIAPPGLSGTLQSVALGLTFGLGRGVGLLVASFIYTLIEQRLLFLIFSIFNLIAAIIYGIYFIINKQRAKKSIENRDRINNVPSKIVIDSEINLNEEPLLVPSTESKSDHRMIEQ